MPIHGALARSGKVRGQTPKVEPKEKKKQPRGRAKKRKDFNKRFMNGKAPPQNRTYPLGNGFTDTNNNMESQQRTGHPRFDFFKTDDAILKVKATIIPYRQYGYLDHTHAQDNSKEEERRQERRLMIKDRMQFILSTLEDGEITSLISFGGEEVIKIPKHAGTWTMQRAIKRLPHIPRGLVIDRINYNLACSGEMSYAQWLDWKEQQKQKEILQLASTSAEEIKKKPSRRALPMIQGSSAVVV